MIIGAAILQTAAWLYSAGMDFPLAFKWVPYIVEIAL